MNTVSFDANGLRLDTSEDAEIICNELTGKNVEILILQGNTFGIEAAERVGQELCNQSSLREAHFKDLFTSRGREEVPEALNHLLNGISASDAKLELLDLSDNAIGPIGAPSVIQFLQSESCESLHTLMLNNCGLGPEGSTSIATTIPRLKNLKTFICGRNRLENKGATNMSNALKELSNLEILMFKQNGIGVEGIQQLASVLEANSNSIKVFDLGDNTIKDTGSKALADVISKCTNLERIHLDDALLENEGFKIICDGLSKSPSLKTLLEASFEGNEIHGQKMIDLIESTFSCCASAFTLDLLENEFTSRELARLESLKNRIDIIVDDINSENDYDDEEKDENDEYVNNNGSNIEDGESDVSNGFVDFGNMESELREVSQDFIATFKKTPFDEDQANTSFMELISTGTKPLNRETNFQAVQILCEELGLMKPETTRKKKPLERDAVIYIGKRIDELPKTFKDFFQVIVKNNDDLSCVKILFDKF